MLHTTHNAIIAGILDPSVEIIDITTAHRTVHGRRITGETQWTETDYILTVMDREIGNVEDITVNASLFDDIITTLEDNVEYYGSMYYTSNAVPAETATLAYGGWC